MTTREEVIAAAKKARFYIYEEDGFQWLATTDDLKPLERFYAIAFKSGRVAEREECDELKSLLKEGATGFGRVLIPTSDDAAVRDWQKRANAAIAKVRKP